MADWFGKDTPKLGFGLMRLPKRGVSIDVAQVSEMVDTFLDAGFTSFDTAHVYAGSEQAIRKALVERHPRESYTLATKLYAPLAPTERSARKQFQTSLKRTGAGYIDYYLLHSLMEGNYKKYERLNLWEYIRDLKKQGLVRHMGFSFHGGPQLLDQLLTQHPEAEFVQLQLNYADWEDNSITARANYEVARAHDTSIVVMEPVKGGRLANPPRDVATLLHDANPTASAASWAIRFAASLDGIITVLSGMSNRAQLQDNVSFMRDFKPLDAQERTVIQAAQVMLGKSAAIPCTVPLLRLIRTPQGRQAVYTKTVRYSDLDVNGHMNNTRYADVALDALTPAELAGRFIGEMQITSTPIRRISSSVSQS